MPTFTHDQFGAGVRPILADDDDDDSEEEEEEPNASEIDSHIEGLGEWVRSNSRSRNTLSETMDVRFRDWDEGRRPARALEFLIGRLIGRALEGRTVPRLLGFAIEPAGWSRPFHIPLRSPTQNTAAAIAAALEKFLADYENEVNLFDGTCRTKICAVWPLGAANIPPHSDSNGPMGACATDLESAKAAAAGVARCQSWVAVVNPDDTLCLARAIVLGLADRSHRLRGRPNMEFRLWAEGQRGEAGKPLAEQLMQAAGIPSNRPLYGVADAQRMQRWLDEEFGGPEHVRLILLERERGWRVVWKAASMARFNLTLVAANNHWSYIQYPNQLFNAIAWCPDCERAVDRRTHPAGCRAVCSMCYRWGLGFPCIRQPGGPTQRCADCGFIFNTAGCFAAHKQTVDPPPPGWAHDRRRARTHRSLCQLRRLCSHCNTIYWTFGAAGATPHQCPPQPVAAQPMPAQAIDNVIQWGGGVAQQQQPQPNPIHCPRCKGLHGADGLQPCFVQPRVFAKQVEWSDGFAPAAASDDEGEDDDNSVESEEGEDMGQQRRQPQQHFGGNVRRERRKPVRFVFWDVETELAACAAPDGQDPTADAGMNIQRQHVPLLVCAEVMCERCILYGIQMEREPKRRAPGCICGVPWQQGSAARRRWCMPTDAAMVAPGDWPVDGLNPRRLAFHQFRLQQDGQPVEQQSAMAQFVDFLMGHGPRRVRTIGLAHNGGRYDIVLLLEELQRRGMRPKRLICTGLRIYQLKLGGRHQRDIVLKDSLNFFGCALGALPATFGLEGVADKPFFPYTYIQRANLHVERAGLPPLADYEPDGMKPTKRRQFLQWYAEEEERAPLQRWVLSEQLLDYCANDVRILRAACLHFRHLVGEHTHGIEPFEAASTIAGLALAIFRQCHLRPNRMVHSPEGGYQRGRKASTESLRFFWLLERELGVQIQTAQWSIGEHRVAEDSGWRLDGLYYRRPPLRPVAVEYNGCFYHGCRDCYPDRLMRLAGGQSAEQLYARTQQRSWELEHVHGFAVRQVWGCQWRKVLAGNRRLRRLAASTARHHLPGPMDLRKHALFGGRVEPFVLHHLCAPDEEICALDIVSLYPFVMKYRPFPLGQAQVLSREQLPIATLPWSAPDQNPFTGFLLCRVLPPRGVSADEANNNNNAWCLPLLPMRTLDDRLVFPLCRECAERRQQRPCHHNELERGWVAAYSHFELNKALQLGYVVTELYEVWHYTEWSTPGPHQLAGNDGLFSAYVDEWLRIKAEASGWPAGCDTDEQRQVYVEEFEQREGIRLRPDHIQLNPGLRALAKAMLNSLWGKLAQRPEGTEVHYTETPRQFHDLLGDARREVIDFTHLNEHLDRVQTRKKPQFAKAPPTNALQIACCVTAHARLHLYDYMQRIRRAGGLLLYCDTDSAMHVRRRGAPPCVPEGDWLGEMKRELPHRNIREFICGGPKNYALLHRCARTGGDERADMKVRSIELTHEARQMLTYRRMKRIVERYFGGDRPMMCAPRHIAVPQRRFLRNRRAEIYTRRAHKIYKPVYSKGIVLSGPLQYHTRSFGWIVAAAGEAVESEEEEGEAEEATTSEGEEEEEDELDNVF